MKQVSRIVGTGPRAVALVAFAAFVAACDGNGGSSARNGGAAAPVTERPSAAAAAPGGVTAAERAEAEQLFGARCAACHGTDGTGNGPGALGLDPKPRNYRDQVWQNTVSDEQIEQAIVYGGAAIGKSPQMVANPDLQAKPGVVRALRMKVRSFAKM